jgi:hypothetical protein
VFAHAWLEKQPFVLGSIASMLAMISYCMMLKATGWQFLRTMMLCV